MLKQSILELIRRTSTCLPHDVRSVIELNHGLETAGSRADLALQLVETNIGLAKARSLPICQDTGTITFLADVPVGYDQIAFTEAACEAVAEATKLGYLRQNSVDSVTEKNTGDNLGPGSPVFHFHQHRGADIDIRLILKGGGCENMNQQYSLPATLQGKKFDRDLDGVRGCVLDAVQKAQGKGCGPGFLGVCIGGDRASAYDFAKRQLLREIDDINPDPLLATLEARILQEANQLNIGPMGFGGKLTVGCCKIGKLNRLPASFFVSISYMCWAYRRRGFILKPDGSVERWLYQVPDEFDQPVTPAEAPRLQVNLGDRQAIRLQTPLDEKTIRSLKAGDMVLLSGKVCTGRDTVHKFLHQGGDIPVLRDSVLYHCGPVVSGGPGTYKVLAAGPTTSIREEPYQAEVMKRYNIRAVIGKGGMGAKTLEACKELGGVYLHAIGGAAQIYAMCTEGVDGVHMKEEFGSPEAVWEMRVKDFPAVVTMDSHGRSLHAEVEKESEKLLAGVM